jgi:hypothetical protein
MVLILIFGVSVLILKKLIPNRNTFQIQLEEG